MVAMTVMVATVVRLAVAASRRIAPGLPPFTIRPFGLAKHLAPVRQRKAWPAALAFAVAVDPWFPIRLEMSAAGVPAINFSLNIGLAALLMMLALPVLAPVAVAIMVMRRVRWRIIAATPHDCSGLIITLDRIVVIALHAITATIATISVAVAAIAAIAGISATRQG